VNIRKIVSSTLREKYTINESFEKIFLNEDDDVRFNQTMEYFNRLIDEGYDNEKLETAIGPYRFNRTQFQELLKYVWRGGYPRWKNDTRPAYVTEMKNKILRNSKGVFRDIDFDEKRFGQRS